MIAKESYLSIDFFLQNQSIVSVCESAGGAIRRFTQQIIQKISDFQ